jgi:predicted transcriptional regulator
MKDKSTIDIAIDHYSILSETQKQILKILVNFDQGAPADTIMKLTGLSKQAVHFSVKKLLQQNIISRKKVRVFVYKANRDKMLEIVNFYNQQKALSTK